MPMRNPLQEHVWSVGESFPACADAVSGHSSGPCIGAARGSLRRARPRRVLQFEITQRFLIAEPLHSAPPRDSSIELCAETSAPSHNSCSHPGEPPINELAPSRSFTGSSPLETWLRPWTYLLDGQDPRPPSSGTRSADGPASIRALASRPAPRVTRGRAATAMIAADVADLQNSQGRD